MNGTSLVCVECETSFLGRQVITINFQELLDLLEAFDLPYNITTNALIEVFGPNHTFELYIHTVH